MNNQEALQLLAIIKSLKPFETVEIKRDEKGNLVYIYTKKEKYILTVDNE